MQMMGISVALRALKSFTAFSLTSATLSKISTAFKTWIFYKLVIKKTVII